MFGDSQAEGLAAGMRRVSRQMPGVKIVNRTKAGTAISQFHTYDWNATIRDYTPEDAVTTAVLMFGGNDRLPMRPAPTIAIPFRSLPWQEEYRNRVADIVKTLTAKKLRVVWVGDPICRDPRYSQDMEFLNQLYRDVLAGTGATFLDIWTTVADADGKYAAHGRTLDGATARLRLDDGIHFTPSGYDIVAMKAIQTVTAAEK